MFVYMQSVGEERSAYRHLLRWWVQCATKINRPSIFWMDFFTIFGNGSFMLMSVCNTTVQPAPWWSSNARQVRQCRHLNHTCRLRTVFGLLCCQLYWTAFSRTKKWILTDRNITDQILQSYSHTHASEEADISPQSDSDKDDITPLTLRLLMSYIHGAPILDVSRSHTTTHHSR